MEGKKEAISQPKTTQDDISPAPRSSLDTILFIYFISVTKNRIQGYGRYARPSAASLPYEI